MKWEQGRRSGNVEDRRGSRGVKTTAAVGGGGAILVLILSLIMGKDPIEAIGALLGSGGAEGAGASGFAVEAPGEAAQAGGTARTGDAAEDRLADMCSVVLADTEDCWNAIFAKEFGKDYVEPKLVIFSDYIQTSCGAADSSSGPFYCPGDRKVYIDLSFYGELQRRFKAPGDFAQAYVLAHEVGHNVQDQLGILDEIQAAKARVSQAEANELSVTLELMADFFAGIWAHYADRSKGLLEAGDLQEALDAAAAIGDDNIQRQARGYVVPESFTHGTSAQRYRYFKLGYDTGDIKKFDL